MATKLAPLTARTTTIEELVRLVNDGAIRVPRFQRGLRWEFADVKRLFESILWGYPIGSLLLWEKEAPAERVRLGALEIRARKLDSALWVVDGQQRLTSLANALSPDGYGDPRYGLDYDLQQGIFLQANENRPENAIPLPVLFDLRRLLSWYTEHPELADLVNEANDVATRLRQYAVPLSVVAEASESVLRDIFDRMNNFGKRLTRAEVFSALNPSAAADPKRELTVAKIAENIDVDQEFGLIDDDTILRIILSRRGSDVTREIREEFEEPGSEFPGETRDEAFEQAEKALRRAVGFLQEDAGIPHLSLLPYRYLLVVLARFFAHYPSPKDRNIVLLRRWFWRAAVLGPEIFKGSATGAMRALNNRIRPDDEDGSIAALLNATNRPPFAWPSMSRFRTNEASTRIVLAALWERGPRSPLSGASYDRHQLAQSLAGQNSAVSVALEIIPRRILEPSQRASAGNRLLLPAEADLQDLRELFGSPRPAWKGEVSWAHVLSSHMMDAEVVAALANGESSLFVDLRSGLIEVLTVGFLQRMAEWETEDTPPLENFDFDDELDSGDI